MKMKLFLGIFICCLYSCKKSTNNTPVKKSFPYYKTFSKKGNLSYNNKTEILFEMMKDADSVYFFYLTKDTIIVSSSSIIKAPSFNRFNKDFHFYKGNFYQLNTHPKTLGKKHKSTDYITVYDTLFNVIKNKNMDISKYPNGSAFLAGDNKKLFYVTDGFKFKESSKLVLSQISDSLTILKQRILKSSNKKAMYNPIKTIFIPNVGILVISSSSYFNVKEANYTLELFDINFNKRWLKKIDTTPIIALNHIKSTNKIIITTKNKVQFYDVKGNNLNNYILEGEVINLALSNNAIFLLVKKSEKMAIHKVSLLGKLINKKEVLINQNNNAYLKYKDNTLFLLAIDNHKKSLHIDKITFE